MQSNVQGESSQQGGAKATEVVEIVEDESREDLFNIDDLIEENESEDATESDEVNVLKADVLDWNSGDEVVEDCDDDIEEHIVMDQSKTEGEFEEIVGEAMNELSEIRSSVNEESEESH